jgi:hypothetical protein
MGRVLGASNLNQQKYPYEIVAYALEKEYNGKTSPFIAKLSEKFKKAMQ